MSIGRMILGRFGSSLIAFIGVSIVIFGIARILPGDPARIALGPSASDEQVAALRAERHLDASIPEQYLRYVVDVLHGDFGQSLYTNRPVLQDIVDFLPRTLELAIFAAIAMILIGLPLGILGAHFRRRWPDHATRIIALLAVSTPGFVWAILLQFIFAFQLGWFPLEGSLTRGVEAPETVTGLVTFDAMIAGNWTAFFDGLHHLVLPAVALAMSGLGQTARLTRSSMGDTYRSPFIEMARAFGFSSRRIATRFAFKPSLTPILTVLGLDFAALLGNAFLIELIFSWPGISRYGVQVILRNDLDAIVGTVLVISGAFLLINLIVDLVVVAINPKLRAELAKGA
ncbi:ABC transporter permease [Psychromarinibacter halotolerans]|uniref:ABC transporter permease n=1 Tax=Psychromarinibacter halotolerans TaxID=1775175 RepID=A0ABV7GMK2_9RHOB|nr:ABC transporter permease [Psychromarinibacter halotolerans]MDF0597390.1 ABC transporter permease [Psychromarinibacter halotolerans]